MNKEELIEVLRQFDEKRVEELPEKTRNIFYAIMKIADERDELNNIIDELEKLVKDYIEKYDVPDTDFICAYLRDILDKLKELKENNNE